MSLFQDPKLVKVYDYTDENGALLHQTLRFEPKTFRQRRPYGRTWINDLKDCRVVLYRLPELLASSYTFLCEGEKDCDSLVALGLVATTNPMGAGKWKQEYTEFLRGKHVIILPDNDEIGVKHACARAIDLGGAAASIKIVKLPDLPEKGDVTDWIAAGGTKEQLRELVKKAVCYASIEQVAKPATFEAEVVDLMNTLPGLDAVPDIAVDWIVADIIPKNSLTILAGEKGSYKSFVCLDLAARVATGYPFAGHQTIATPVIYLDRENSAQIVNQRKYFLGIGGTSAADGLSYWGTWMKEDPCGIRDDRLIATAERHKPLIVFDSLIRFCQGKDENSAEAMAKVTELFRTLTKVGATILVIAHKSDKVGASPYRGSSEILAGCDMGWSLVKQGGGLVEWRGIKNRFGEEGMLQLKIEKGGFTDVGGTVIVSSRNESTRPMRKQ